MNNNNTSSPSSATNSNLKKIENEKCQNKIIANLANTSDTSRSETPTVIPTTPTKEFEMDIDATEEEEFSPFKTKRTEPFRFV